MVEYRVGGVDFSNLLCLDSGRNLNLTSNDMSDLRRQCIAVDDDNEPYPEKISYEVPQTVNDFNWKPEGIILPRRSNIVYHTYAAFKNYSREEVMKMTKLELFLILFPVDHLKEVLVPETNKLLKHPTYLGEFIRWLRCWLCMGFWV